MCCYGNLQRKIKLKLCGWFLAAFSSFPRLSVTAASWRSATPELPHPQHWESLSVKRTHTFQDDSLWNRIPYTPQQNLVFVNVWPPVRKLLYCSIKACMLALISAGSRHSYSEFRWWVKPRCLCLRSGRHAGPRHQDLCDRPADLLGGPHNSFCKQMGIYQLDHRLLSGLFNPIIGFRFKQVIKTAARAFFRSSWSERSGRSQNFSLKGDRMNAKNVPAELVSLWVCLHAQYAIPPGHWPCPSLRACRGIGLDAKVCWAPQ